MSTTSRLISGSVASWAQIGLTMLFQIALVPLYLTHWNAQTYGVWIAVQALISIITTLDFGYHEFLAYEFLRFGQKNRPELSRSFTAGVAVCLLINLFQLIVIGLIVYCGILPLILGGTELIDPQLLRTAGIILFLQGLIWLVNNSIVGLIFRALAPFGYYPRTVWWNFFYSIVSNLAPVIAVIFGADLLTAGLITAAAAFLFSIPLYIDLSRLLRKEQIRFVALSWKLGYRNFMYSLAISGKGLLENLRQQGVRLIIAPLVGTLGLTAFSTMRTGSNVALQGLNTIVHPLMPELMRFLHERDQPRSEAAFGTIWFVLVAFMAPGIVILQAFISPLYLAWTQGKVPFDPYLFACLSLSLLVFAVVQPAMAVVKGNNLLRPQLSLSVMAALIVIVGIFILVPRIGIVGAGISLLVAEIAATIGYKIVATRWLHTNGLSWPKRPFIIAVTSIWISAAAMLAMILLPKFTWIVLPCSVLFLLTNAWRYWKVLPTFATQNALKIAGSFLALKRKPKVRLNN